ncbi:MAG TPA: transglutaminase family protein [Luteolibacter sp.]
MRYLVTHRTCYAYTGAVTVSHHLAHLAPRALPSQRSPWHELTISPSPVTRHSHEDAFGNIATYFEIEGEHTSLEVMAKSLVEITPMPLPLAADTPSWETIRKACQDQSLTPSAAAGEFRFSSSMVPVSPVYADYAKEDFSPGRPILEASQSLMTRIFHDFRFDTRATDIATPVAEVLERRAGVCQDFAHFMLACLRSLGLPARYVSGYLETVPPEGRERLIGADASHAWLAVYAGQPHGWIDLDPTNNLLPGERHITIGWGRDFSDVSPLRGVTLGSGGQTLNVSVDVMPLTGAV